MKTSPEGVKLLPCPFCGTEASTRRHMTESLFSHATVEYLQISCERCDGAQFCGEQHDEIVASWNRRSPIPATVEAGVVDILGSDLRANIKALLELDAVKALVPHGIGGHARELFKQVLALPSTPAWRPIETAPENQDILVYVKPIDDADKQRIHVGQRAKIANGHLWKLGHYFAHDIGKPVAWTPLPSSPVSGGEEE